MTRRKRGFGQVRRLPSKRWQAFYTGPDTRLHYAPSTFDAKEDAEGWLTDERRIIASGNWMPPEERRAAQLAGLPPTLEDYATGWMRSRTLKPRTKALYQRLLDRHILPELGHLRLDAITPTVVRTWHTKLGPGAPTQRAHAYAVLKTIMGTAVDEEIISKNPCKIRGAGTVQTVHKPKPASLEELTIIAATMPPHLQLSVLIAAWCALRMGEIFELRRGDIDLKESKIHVRRAVGRVPGEKPIVDTPKSKAGVRDVDIPPHLLGEFERHLATHVASGRDALLFTGRWSGEQVASSTLYRWFYPAREAAGRPDLRWHDLRHTGGTLAAIEGATLRELMDRLGHSTVAAAMIYQHAAEERGRVIAELLSKRAGWTP